MFSSSPLSIGCSFDRVLDKVVDASDHDRSMSDDDVSCKQCIITFRLKDGLSFYVYIPLALP